MVDWRSWVETGISVARFVADGVGGAVGVAALDARAGQPDGVASGVVVAADVLQWAYVAAAVFLHGGSAEFRAPDDVGCLRGGRAA